MEDGGKYVCERDDVLLEIIPIDYHLFPYVPVVTPRPPPARQERGSDPSNVASSSATRCLWAALEAAISDVPAGRATSVLPSVDDSARYLMTRRPASDCGFGVRLRSGLDGVYDVPLDELRSGQNGVISIRDRGRRRGSMGLCAP